MQPNQPSQPPRDPRVPPEPTNDYWTPGQVQTPRETPHAAAEPYRPYQSEEDAKWQMPAQASTAPPITGQYSIDYLNQIAPPTPKSTMSNKLFFGVVIGGLLLTVAVGFLLITSAQPSNSARMLELATKLQMLQKISTDAGENITSNQLQSINGNLATQLTNATQSMANPMAASGVDIKKISKKTAEAAGGQALASKLDDARLNAVYDRTYAREMTYQLSSIFGLMRQINSQTKKASTQKFLQETSNNLQPVGEQLENFNDTTSG